MASPQIENGYTMLSNELLEAFSMVRISGEENQLFWFIIRKTYGFKKKDDAISLSQFSLGTGINKPNVCRALSKLITKNMIIKNDNGLITKYRIQKDYTSWKPLSKKIIKAVIKKDNLPLSKKIHTKETLTKEKTTISFNRLTGDFEGIPERIINKWKKLYIYIDIEQTIKELASWRSANPQKHYKNNHKFLVNNISRENKKEREKRGDNITEEEYNAKCDADLEERRY